MFLCDQTLNSQPYRRKREDGEQKRRQNEVLESRSEIASMPHRQDANVIGRWRSQNDFRYQISLQEFSAKENHCRGNNEPGCGNPFHGINRFVVERKVIDGQHGNSGARIEDKWRSARPAINSDLIGAKREKICAEQAFSLRLRFLVCNHRIWRGIIVLLPLCVHAKISLIAILKEGPDLIRCALAPC